MYYNVIWYVINNISNKPYKCKYEVSIRSIDTPQACGFFLHLLYMSNRNISTTIAVTPVQ